MDSAYEERGLAAHIDPDKGLIVEGDVVGQPVLPARQSADDAPPIDLERASWDVAMADGKVSVEREIGGGAREVVEMTMPCLVGAARGLNEPRYPKLPDIMKAKKKEVQEVDLGALGIEAGDPMLATQRLEPAPDRATAQMLDGAPAEMAERLITLLRGEAKVI